MSVKLVAYAVVLMLVTMLTAFICASHLHHAIGIINQWPVEQHRRDYRHNKTRPTIARPPVRKNNSLISYRLVRGLRLNVSRLYYRCDKGERRPLPPNLRHAGMLDFHTEIATRLKILTIGDSMGIQMNQALERAAGAPLGPPLRTVLRDSWKMRGTGKAYEGITLSAPVRGGGAVAGWRITGVLSNKGRNKWRWMPNRPGGGWIAEDASTLRRHLFNAETSRKMTVGRPMNPDNATTHNDTRADEFDVIVHQFPGSWLAHPWTPQFTNATLGEAVRLSHDAFGARTVILQTIFVSNNVNDIANELGPVNQAIRDFARGYAPRTGSEMSEGVKHVLVLDVGALTLRLFYENAKAIGMVNNQTSSGANNSSIATSQQLDELLKKRLQCCHKLIKRPIALACAERVREGARSCIQNQLVEDGGHWCMGTIGGRVHAGLACLLQCVYRDDGDESAGQGEEEMRGGGAMTAWELMRRCEAQCNAKYMSLEPVPWGDKKVLDF